MKNSKQRNLVLDIINKSHNHPTAYEIYDIAKKQVPNISLGTIYRNLNFLDEYNFIRHINTNDGIVHYDKVYKKHSHFICNICNRIYDIDEVFFEKDFINGNKVLNYDLRYFGVCSCCLKKEEINYGIKRK